MIAIVNYGMGNLRSVLGALEFLGADACVTDSIGDLRESEKVVLPGVGSFRAAMENIRKLGFEDVIRRSVVDLGKPILGVCLGMQLLADSGDEDGPTPGLGLIRGAVKRFPFDDASLPVPHVGFNSVRFVPHPEDLAAGLGERADFYFVHSYRMVCAEAGDVAGWCEYGEPFVAAVQKGRIYGTQFHPEKSQSNGLKVLKNFIELKA